jgi:Ran GTPase-activating protein (RanGAP) involved in mRNA processing and transport
VFIGPFMAIATFAARQKVNIMGLISDATNLEEEEEEDEEEEEEEEEEEAVEASLRTRCTHILSLSLSLFLV